MQYPRVEGMALLNRYFPSSTTFSLHSHPIYDLFFRRLSIAPSTSPILLFSTNLLRVEYFLRLRRTQISSIKLANWSTKKTLKGKSAKKTDENEIDSLNAIERKYSNEMNESIAK